VPTAAPRRSLDVAYDDNSNIKTLTYPDGTVVSQAFDAANRTCWTYVGSSSAACGSPPSGSIQYAYDDNSNMTSETLPNGVVNSYTYDHANALATISDAHSGTTIFAANYTRNNDNMVTVDDSQPSTAQKYKYTSKNQLCYADSANSGACGSGSPTYPYAYDNAGNLTTNKGGSQAYDTKNQLCWSLPTSSANACGSPPTGATTYGFDSNGNRTSAVPSSGSATCNTYDSGRNTLASVKTGTGSSCTSPTTVGTYAYDGNALRMSKTVGSTTTSFDWSENGLPLMLDEKVASTYTDYVIGPRGNVLAQISGATTVYFSSDNLGSTRAITNSSGTSIATYAYGPYGDVTACTGTTVTVSGSNLCTGTVAVSNRLLFAGQYRDDETGLYYLRARYYDTGTAQFVTVDPLVWSTMVPFGYGGGDPIDNADPSGKDYNYYYSYYLGRAYSQWEPYLVLRKLLYAPSTWPFAVHNQSFPYSAPWVPGFTDGVGGLASSLQPGHYYSLCFLGQCSPVAVTSAWYWAGGMSLTFLSMPGHIEGSYSRIRFSSWVSGGNLYWDVTAHDTFDYAGVHNALFWDTTLGFGAHLANILGAAHARWNTLAQTLDASF
jgi:RHS repeat-associated protein